MLKNITYNTRCLHVSLYLYGEGGQGKVVSYPSSALIFCEGWKMLLQESNHSLGNARPQLLSSVQLTLFDISKAWPNVNQCQTLKMHLSRLSGTVLIWMSFSGFNQKRPVIYWKHLKSDTGNESWKFGICPRTPTILQTSSGICTAFSWDW